jgi:hypothetical protein
MNRPGYYVGRWIRRASRSSSRWHIVESKIADGYITRCGRRMQRNLASSGAEVEFHTEVPGEDACRYCWRDTL